jgi:2,5-diketo-D-gluconate reductase A
MEQTIVKLNDGREMPQLGLGVWQTPAGETARVVGLAIEAGYRSIDTAAAYGNEAGVGEAVRTSAVPREDLFVTTKLRNDEQDRAAKAFDESLVRLGLDHVDLYLIHWPVPQRGRYVEVWRALIRVKEEGRARSIGVSNFNADHLERIIGETGIVPALNQIELHPRFQQKTLREFHARHGIATQCWSPLGKALFLDDPAIAAVARKHGKTPAQTVIRWHLDLGLVPIPKSANAARIRENFAVFDFRLDADDLASFARLDTSTGRTGPDPLAFA